MSGQVNIQSGGLDIRVEVNPSAYHDEDVEVYVARFRDASRLPKIGDEITVVQPDDDPSEPDYVSTAKVLNIDHDHGLLTLRVDWKGFHDLIPSNPSPIVNYKSATVLRQR